MTNKNIAPKEQQDTLAKTAEEQNKSLANMRTSALRNAGVSIKSIFYQENLDAVTLHGNLKAQIEKTLEGNTRYMEGLLITQAQTLNALFHFAAGRINASTMLPNLNAYADLAIQASNACRKSLLTISHIRNPAKTTFIKHQNNAVNQQINHQTSEPDNEILKKSEKNMGKRIIKRDIS